MVSVSKALAADAGVLADFAGGGMICVQGILLALIERARSGRGQVIVTDMVRFYEISPVMSLGRRFI